MLRYERSEDAGLIRSIITNPRVYPWLTDDSSPSREDFQPTIHPLVWYVLVWDEKELLGLFMLTGQGAACVEVHTCLLPNAWGERTVAAARGMSRWVWENTRSNRIITHVPIFNRLARRLAIQAGMRQFGLNEKSFLKRGQLYDQMLFGITREN